MFRFKFTLNDDDYIEFNKYQFLNSQLGKKTLVLQRIIIPVLSVLLILILWVIEASTDLIIIESIFLTIVSVLYIIFAKSIVLRNLKKNIEKLKKDGKLPYSKEVELIFDDGSIVETTPENETKFVYSVIERIAETEKAVYVFISSTQAHIIPLSAFVDISQRKRFIEFIENKIAYNI